VTATEPLTTRQHEVLAFYRMFIAKHGFSPPLREVGRGVGIRSVNGVRQHVLVLQAKGYLKSIVTSPRGSLYPVEVTP
jgi:repressor LexA